MSAFSAQSLLASDIHHINFNQDSSCVAIGTKRGFAIYSLNPIELRYFCNNEGIKYVEMLYLSSLVALVGSGDQAGSSPRKLQLWNTQKQETICEMSFPSTILTVLMNKQRLIICFEFLVCVYDLTSMERLLALTTTSNSQGVIALSNESSSYLVFPTGELGCLVMYDCMSLRLINQIEAHKNAIVALQFSSQGSMLATASATGTVIRVYSVPMGQHLCSFRRGSKPSSINSLSFCPLSKWLAVGSSTGTIHLFSVEQALARDSAVMGESNAAHMRSSDSGNSNNTSIAQSAISYLGAAQTWGSSVVGGWNVFPDQVQEFADSIRAKAQARIPDFDSRDSYKVAICSVLEESASTEDLTLQTPLKLVVVTSSKHLYRFNIPEGISNDELNAVLQCSLVDEALLEI